MWSIKTCFVELSLSDDTTQENVENVKQRYYIDKLLIQCNYVYTIVFGKGVCTPCLSDFVKVQSSMWHLLRASITEQTIWHIFFCLMSIEKQFNESDVNVFLIKIYIALNICYNGVELMPKLQR